MSGGDPHVDSHGSHLLPQPGPAERREPGALRHTFAALRHRNYRLWFVGQMISLAGGWMQITAQGFLVFELTGSAAYLGLVGFATGVPAWFLTLYGGVVADRVSRRTLLVITQSLLTVQALVLAALTLSDLIQPLHIVALAAFLGAVNAFDAPARQAFVLEMVERKDLANAIALNSATFNSATLIGPAIAGLVYAWRGPGWCFAINAVSFAAVIAALVAMRLPPRAGAVHVRSTIDDLRQAFTFVWRQRLILTLLLALAATSVFGISMVTLIPAWTVRILDGDATTNGLLLSARGIGSLSGALMVAWLARLEIKGRLLSTGLVVTPVLMLLFSLTDSLPFALIVLAGLGWAFLTIFNTLNALVQLQVPDELRGRIMGLYTLTFFGLMPVGSLLVGLAADHLGEPTAIQLGALVLASFTLAVNLRFPGVRRLR